VTAPSSLPGAPKTLVIYAGDAGYAYPMLLSARSVRRNASNQNFDLWIFAADYPDDLLAATAAVAETFEAQVVPLASESYIRFDVRRFRPEDGFAHLKPSVLSRLVTGPLIPERYDQVLYLDGDTLCVGDMSPLIQFRVPAGRLLATRDAVNYYKFDNGRFAAAARDLMIAMGLEVTDTWYNTGVLMADRRTWAERGAAALDYFIAHIDACRFPVDGSANATAKDHWAPISCRWNFMAPMRLWGLDEAVKPAFYHFTGREKPWLGRMAPWSDFWPLYEKFRTERPIGALAGPLAGAAEIASANRHRVLGRIKEATIHSARAARARRGVLASEQDVLI
jgi:lipopolysaccharide biosynthesis glycosyltransferase